MIPNEQQEIEPPAAIEDPEATIAQLRDMLAARDRFLAIAAHELRNPMAPLVLQVGQLLKSARKGELSRVTDGLELLETIVARYVKRANVLLDVSRLASDRVTLEPTTLDIGAWVARIAAGFAPAAAQAGSELLLEAPEGLVGYFDRMAIEQILENLLSNAIKFGPGKPVEVAVRGEGGRVRISVGDHGPGISPEDQERIFAPFEQVIARAEGGGFGVGLWVVDRLVAEMGGVIELDSRLGKGAIFSVVLPLDEQSGPT
jgi:signal transduction histidine kinase